VAAVTSDATVDCDGLRTRDINRQIRHLIDGGARDIRVRNPAGRHSLAVALKGEAISLEFDGPVGWYAAGMNWGPRIVVRANAGWGIGECMMGGRIEVHGHAGSGAAASIRGGLVFVEGDTAARAGIAMKGGTLVVGGSVGYMSGFMMQKGTIIVCGDAADGVGDSMYEGTIYVGGEIASRGADAAIEDMSADDHRIVAAALAEAGIDPSGLDFTKIRSGRRLWNFSTKEPELWTAAL
jgi:methylamine---glutamate N-methyltransferase subunit B